MDLFEESESAAINFRLKTEVARHRGVGALLTCGILHEIEEEAFQRIETGGDLSPLYLRTMRSSPLLAHPRTDEDFGDSNLLSPEFFLIHRAYNADVETFLTGYNARIMEIRLEPTFRRPCTAQQQL